MSELIDYVATQLRAASESAPERGGPIMKFDQCTMEMTVAVEWKATAGIRVWVIEAGAGGSRSTSQKITVSFTPIPGQQVLAAVAEADKASSRPVFEGPTKPAD